LDLLGAYWDNLRRSLDGLYRCAKFGCNRCSSFDNMKLSIFGPFGLKRPIHAPKHLGFRGISPPKWGTMSAKVNKGTSMRESASFEPLVAKIYQPVRPVAEFMKKGINKKTHARTVVRECCKGDDESLWERGKFDSPPPKPP